MDTLLSNIIELKDQYFQQRKIAFDKYWDFYSGDSQRNYLPKFEGESVQDYIIRREKAVIENHCRQINNVAVGYLYGMEVNRRAEDPELQKFLLERVWDTNHLWSFMLNVALMASITGVSIVNLSLVDYRTNLPFAIGNPTKAQVRAYGSIKYTLMDSSETMPIMRGSVPELGGIVHIYYSDNSLGSGMLDRLLKKEYSESEIIEYADDNVWYRWIGNSRDDTYKQINVSGVINGKNPYNDIRIPFCVFKNFGDPMFLEGTPDHLDAIPLNTELNERSNDDANVISFHSYPVLKFLNGAKMPDNWIRSAASVLEFDRDQDAEYLTWDNIIDASQKRQETLRQSIVRCTGYSDLSLGNTERIGQLRSGPALKTLFLNDTISILEKQATYQKAEKDLIRATARMYEYHSGIKFDSYKADIKYPEDFMGIDELIKAQIDAQRIGIGLTGIDEVIKEENPSLTDAQVLARVKKNIELNMLAKNVKTQRQKSSEESELEQEE